MSVNESLSELRYGPDRATLAYSMRRARSLWKHGVLASGIEYATWSLRKLKRDQQARIERAQKVG